MKPYEIIDHPADTGLKIYGSTEEELFSNAAAGFYSLLTGRTGFEAGEKNSVHSLTLRADSLEDLFFEWLRELLFLFSSRSWILERISFTKIAPPVLEARARIHVFDPERDEPGLEVKAVTYHQFYLRRTADGFEAQVIFDI